MYVRMLSASVIGVEGRLIEVEVDISSGLPQVHVVGLPDPAVRESVDRVRAAIKNGGMKFPLDRITVNLAPADMRKEGSAFDLAIAAGILCASGQLTASSLEGSLLIGELSLNGEVKPVPGVLPMVEKAREAGLIRAYVPQDCAAEAALIDGIEIIGLSALTAWNEGSDSNGCKDTNSIHTAAKLTRYRNNKQEGIEPDLADVNGQIQGKRALLLAAAGMHNLLFVGPPGTGKTMLCRRLPTLLPPLADDEALEVTKIYSVCGKLGSERPGLIRTRPFRSPHHTISTSGLVGGGSVPKPGEATLAHHGVLFLDELPEFQRAALESLRQPLEDRHITIGRARGVTRFPANFMLAASMNPCLCGFLGSQTGSQTCTCSPVSIARYRARMSGPLADRIDLQVEIPRQTQRSSTDQPLSSETARQLLEVAYERQRYRYRQEDGIRWNSELTGRWLSMYSGLTKEADSLLGSVYAQLGLSYRAHDRILKLSRTIADLADEEQVTAEHIAEAIQYRCLDKSVIV